MMHPLIFLDYPSIKDIIKLLEKIGLTKKRKLNPLTTNCHMLWLITSLDMDFNNYSIYVEHLCTQIRQGKTSRLKWSILLPVGGWLLKHKLVKRKQIKKALEYIDLSLDDIIK